MIGFAVLGDDEGVAFGELADLGAGEDGDVLAGDGPAAVRPVCQVVRATRTGPRRSEISWLKATSLEPPNMTRVLVRPSTARASWSPKIWVSWARVWAAQMNEIPRARSLAIRVCRVGSGAVEGSSSRQASIGGHSRPHGEVLASGQGGVQDVFGDGGHQR